MNPTQHLRRMHGSLTLRRSLFPVAQTAGCSTGQTGSRA